MAAVFIKTLREKVVINENGHRKTVTKFEAALKQLVNKAASGDIRALQQLLECARDAEAKQNASVVQNPVIEGFDQEVIDGIMRRFNQVEGGQELQDATQGANDVDDQHG
jgi:hypothetical protein